MEQLEIFQQTRQLEIQTMIRQVLLQMLGQNVSTELIIVGPFEVIAGWASVGRGLNDLSVCAPSVYTA
eukprot:7753558-Pyramimonas_sp.AAC.1